MAAMLDFGGHGVEEISEGQFDSFIGLADPESMGLEIGFGSLMWLVFGWCHIC